MSTPQSRKSLLSDLCVDCTRELFGAYQMPIDFIAQGVPAEIGEFAACGVIGFNGDGVRGTLRIAATRKALEDSMPVSEGTIEDWLGELANQLLGRLKRKLRAAGAEFTVTTPLTMDGQWVAQVPDVPQGGDGLLRFSADSGSAVCVWFDTDMDVDVDSLTAELDGANNADGPEEGDLMLF